MQVPGAATVMVLPLVLHTEAVSDDTVTASPELEVATTWNGETPNVLLVCGANVMNCGVDPALRGCPSLPRAMPRNR